jgi:hypothetical protein
MSETENFVSMSIAPVKSAFLRSDTRNWALTRQAPRKSAVRTSEVLKIAPFKLAFEKSALLMSVLSNKASERSCPLKSLPRKSSVTNVFPGLPATLFDDRPLLTVAPGIVDAPTINGNTRKSDGSSAVDFHTRHSYPFVINFDLPENSASSKSYDQADK